MTKRRVVALVLVLVVAPALFVAEQAVETLYTLGQVERQRDTWQRPEQILRSLNLRSGITVVDLGSGAGYFALKMAPLLAPHGRVLAVDVRRQSLAFLWIRALLGRHWNLHVIRGEADDPHLPPGPVDAALVANTFHELTMPEPVLNALFSAMRAGARCSSLSTAHPTRLLKRVMTTSFTMTLGRPMSSARSSDWDSRQSCATITSSNGIREAHAGGWSCSGNPEHDHRSPTS